MHKSFNINSMPISAGMSLKLIRISRLKQFATQRQLKGPVALGVVIGKKTAQTSNLLTGLASFGEKVARSIEEAAGLPANWLDHLDGEDAPPPPVVITRIGPTTPRQALDTLGALIAEADDLTRDQIKPMFARMCDEPGRIPEILKRIESALDAGNQNSAAESRPKSISSGHG
jgi:hypothetical protein